MTRYRVSLSGARMDFGLLGSAGTSYAAFNDVADSREDAIEKARAVAREKMPSYADGKATVEIMHNYAITLRGRSDKRKRETYFTYGADEYEALKNVGYLRAANIFAGFYGPRGGRKSPKPDDRIVKIEEV